MWEYPVYSKTGVRVLSCLSCNFLVSFLVCCGRLPPNNRWASNDALKNCQDQSRANDEAILKAIKELDKRFYEKVDLQNEALLKVGWAERAGGREACGKQGHRQGPSRQGGSSIPMQWPSCQLNGTAPLSAYFMRLPAAGCRG